MIRSLELANLMLPLDNQISFQPIDAIDTTLRFSLFMMFSTNDEKPRYSEKTKSRAVEAIRYLL